MLMHRELELIQQGFVRLAIFWMACQLCHYMDRMLAYLKLLYSILKDAIDASKAEPCKLGASCTMHETLMKRITITLPDAAAAELEDWAQQQGRPVANLATFLVELGIREAKEKGDYSPATKTK
jgi:hypothetical protein